MNPPHPVLSKKSEHLKESCGVFMLRSAAGQIQSVQHRLAGSGSCYLIYKNTSKFFAVLGIRNDFFRIRLLIFRVPDPTYVI